MKARNGKFFSRGVHFRDMKFISKDCPIRRLEAPDVASIAVQQHIGKPAAPVVEVGDTVKCGQLIAKADGFVSANIYSSVSGNVIAIEKRANPRGGLDTHIVIKRDENADDTFVPLEPLKEKTKETIIARIAEAGIVGMGGAGFPTFIKLSPKTPVDTLIINAAECEPYLTCDYRLMIEKTDELVQGFRLIAKALGVSHIIVGVEKNKPDAVALFEKYDDLDVVILRKRYPMGSEKHLIYCCTGRRVQPGKLPADAGCVVQNIATSYAVYEAVELNKPLFERVVTVSGQCVENPANLIVRFGTSFDYILDKCGGIKGDIGMIIDGGPMMGATMLSTDYYTRKTDSGLLLLPKSEVSLKNPTPCISCGSCARACPMHLMPMDIDFYTQAGDYIMARDRGGVLNCIECGSCAYVCPANRAIVQSVQLCKQKLREMK